MTANGALGQLESCALEPLDGGGLALDLPRLHGGDWQAEDGEAAGGLPAGADGAGDAVPRLSEAALVGLGQGGRLGQKGGQQGKQKQRDGA